MALQRAQQNGRQGLAIDHSTSALQVGQATVGIGTRDYSAHKASSKLTSRSMARGFMSPSGAVKRIQSM